VQRRARRALHRIHRTQKPGPDGPVEGLFVSIQRPNDDSTTFTGAPFDPERFRRRGILVASGRASGDVDVQAVVPDGVATLTVRYDRPDREFTGTVRDNVVSVRVTDAPRWMLDATFIWRGPDGAVVNQYDL
jgi:hypothetical protein